MNHYSKHYGSVRVRGNLSETMTPASTLAIAPDTNDPGLDFEALIIPPPPSATALLPPFPFHPGFGINPHDPVPTKPSNELGTSTIPCTAALWQKMNKRASFLNAPNGITAYPNPAAYPCAPGPFLLDEITECGCCSGESSLTCVPRLSDKNEDPTTASTTTNSKTWYNNCNFYYTELPKGRVWSDSFSATTLNEYFKYPKDHNNTATVNATNVGRDLKNQSNQTEGLLRRKIDSKLIQVPDGIETLPVSTPMKRTGSPLEDEEIHRGPFGEKESEKSPQNLMVPTRERCLYALKSKYKKWLQLDSKVNKLSLHQFRKPLGKKSSRNHLLYLNLEKQLFSNVDDQLQEENISKLEESDNDSSSSNRDSFPRKVRSSRKCRRQPSQRVLKPRRKPSRPVSIGLRSFLSKGNINANGSGIALHKTEPARKEEPLQCKATSEAVDLENLPPIPPPSAFAETDSRLNLHQFPSDDSIPRTEQKFFERQSGSDTEECNESSDAESDQAENNEKHQRILPITDQSPPNKRIEWSDANSSEDKIETRNDEGNSSEPEYPADRFDYLAEEHLITEVVCMKKPRKRFYQLDYHSQDTSRNPPDPVIICDLGHSSISYEVEPTAVEMDYTCKAVTPFLPPETSDFNNNVNIPLYQMMSLFYVPPVQKNVLQQLTKYGEEDELMMAPAKKEEKPVVTQSIGTCSRSTSPIKIKIHSCGHSPLNKGNERGQSPDYFVSKSKNQSATTETIVPGRKPRTGLDIFSGNIRRSPHLARGSKSAISVPNSEPTTSCEFTVVGCNSCGGSSRRSRSFSSPANPSHPAPSSIQDSLSKVDPCGLDGRSSPKNIQQKMPTNTCSIQCSSTSGEDGKDNSSMEETHAGPFHISRVGGWQDDIDPCTPPFSTASEEDSYYLNELTSESLIQTDLRKLRCPTRNCTRPVSRNSSFLNSSQGNSAISDFTTPTTVLSMPTTRPDKNSSSISDSCTSNSDFEPVESSLFLDNEEEKVELESQIFNPIIQESDDISKKLIVKMSPKSRLVPFQVPTIKLSPISMGPFESLAEFRVSLPPLPHMKVEGRHLSFPNLMPSSLFQLSQPDLPPPVPRSAKPVWTTIKPATAGGIKSHENKSRRSPKAKTPMSAGRKNMDPNLAESDFRSYMAATLSSKKKSKRRGKKLKCFPTHVESNPTPKAEDLAILPETDSNNNQQGQSSLPGNVAADVSEKSQQTGALPVPQRRTAQTQDSTETPPATVRFARSHQKTAPPALECINPFAFVPNKKEKMERGMNTLDRPPGRRGRGSPGISRILTTKPLSAPRPPQQEEQPSAQVCYHVPPPNSNPTGNYPQQLPQTGGVTPGMNELTQYLTMGGRSFMNGALIEGFNSPNNGRIMDHPQQPQLIGYLQAPGSNGAEQYFYPVAAAPPPSATTPPQALQQGFTLPAMMNPNIQENPEHFQVLPPQSHPGFISLATDPRMGKNVVHPLYYMTSTVNLPPPPPYGNNDQKASHKRRVTGCKKHN